MSGLADRGRRDAGAGWKPTVLMVHNYYQIPGGEDTVFGNEIEMLRNHGHKVVVYTRRNSDIHGFSGKLNAAVSLFWSRRTMEDIREMIRAEDVDIVHCHNVFPLISPSVYKAAEIEGVPVFQTVHNFRLICPNALLFRNGRPCEDCVSKGVRCAIPRKCYRASYAQTVLLAMSVSAHRLRRSYRKVNMVFLTEFNREKHRAFLEGQGCRSYVKPNFIAGEHFVGEGRVDDSRSILFVGRLEPEKGILELLECWESGLIDDFNLVVIGDGSLKAAVEKAASENPGIVYLGSLSHEDTLRRIESSHALAFPSKWYEGMPMVIVEALSLGVPVIVASRGNQGALVNSSCGGVCVERFDPIELRAAIDVVGQNRDLLSSNGLRYYEESLSERANYDQLIEIYETGSSPA